MADRGTADRSHEPTARRWQRAREMGQVAQSRELTSTLVFLAGASLLYATQSFLIQRWSLLFHSATEALGHVGPSDQDLLALLTRLFLSGTGLVLLVAGAGALLGVVLSAVQTGLLFTWNPVIPSFDRLNAVEGFQRLFSKRTAIEIAKALLKSGGLLWVLWHSLRPVILSGAFSLNASPQQLLPTVAHAIFSLAGGMALWMAIISGTDYWVQRRNLHQDLMMTRQEVRDESKETEGNPKTKMRIKQLMKKLSGRRMMKKVPQATVVVTNPTHIAIALQYSAALRAPIVLAKGADRLAEKIRDIARLHNIPLVENKVLARILYRRVDVDSEIPAFLYQAVAEVLSYVYRLRRGGPR